MASSRLFIRGLPPTLKEDELHRHFSRTAPVTDTKLISHRRIGYVGYKTPDDALQALNYFNRTYIQTSKIRVELAKSVNELRPDQIQSGKFQSEDNSISPNGGPDPKKDAKLKEFIETMQPSKARQWEVSGAPLSSVGRLPQQQQQQEQEEQLQVNGDGHGNEDDYEPLPKRRKTENATVSSLAKTAQPSDDPDEQDSSEQRVLGTTASDADWLRSRTTNLLGLDDDEILGSGSDEDDTLVKGGARLQRKADVTTARSEASSQTDQELHETDAKPIKVDETVKGGVDIDERRLFVRNVSYQTKEDELRDYFTTFGSIEEVHIPRATQSGSSKGFAYIQFATAEQANAAIVGANARPYQGRLLHIMPAMAKRDEALDEYAISKLPHKKQQHIRRKADAAAAVFRWNTLFMNADAVLSSTAAKLGLSKAEILDPTSSNAAVKQAHAETNIIQETRAFFKSNGVNIESFSERKFSDTVILVKNFSYGTTVETLRQLFQVYGPVKRLLMPPAGTMAIVEFEMPDPARKAFNALAYRKLADSVLLLEKAPKGILDGTVVAQETPGPEITNLSSADLMVTQELGQASATLFVKNLNFDTTSVKLEEVFRPIQGFLSARVKTKPNLKIPGQTLSMGFGFVEFRSKDEAQAALAAMNGYVLDGHQLELRSSHKGLDAAEERRREDKAKKLAGRNTKIIIRNLPFEATRRDVRDLFEPYGKLRSIRVPKKFDSSTRGFAFADFVTVKEAQNAMEAMTGTHLLGRRLNLDYANEESVDPEKEIEEMSKKVGRQVEKVHARQLSTNERRKFTVQRSEEDDVS